MKILVTNLGSTSFKYRLFDMADERVLARGGVERIGSEKARCYASAGGVSEEALLASWFCKVCAKWLKLPVSSSRAIFAFWLVSALDRASSVRSSRSSRSFCAPIASSRPLTSTSSLPRRMSVPSLASATASSIASAPSPTPRAVINQGDSTRL